MGQKSNPNSFNLKKKTAIVFGGSHGPTEYSTVLKESLFVSTNFVTLFEKHNCLVKECFFTSNSDKPFITIFISFLILKPMKKRGKKHKRGDKKKKKLKKTRQFSGGHFIIKNLFSVLAKFGHISSKRIILQNLRTVSLNAQKTDFSVKNFKSQSFLKSFRKEIYFGSAITLLCLMNISRNNASLISKFIARFFRSFHRTKKIYKFLSFLSKFIQCAEAIYQEKNSTQGLKFQIKGRFSGTPRSRIRIFERGRIPLQTIISKIDYSLIHVNTSYGVFGVKVWIFE